ncbi:hypothetical protein HY994_03175 [Candidatus Micrarchaeota archaeon]|nr:hypothetical protein [Candidatus Micrarchaeota archaeon]
MEQPRPLDAIRKVIHDVATREKIPVAFIDEESSNGKIRLIAYLSHRNNYVKTSRKTDLALIDRDALERISESIRSGVNIESIKIQSHFWPRSDHENLNPHQFHSILVVKTSISAENQG